MPKPFSIFISYSHKDMALCQELTTHLSILKQEKIISTWTDRDISPGTEWERQILDELKNAQIILLLISADFLTSPFCQSVEMAEALERHKANNARVIPIILRPVYWEIAPFAKLQAFPLSSENRPLPVISWPVHDDAFRNIVQGIHVIAEELEQKEKLLLDYVLLRASMHAVSRLLTS
jgi:hypothetical protein